MLKAGSILFIISLILGFKFEVFQYLALGIIVFYVVYVPYFFLYLKTCHNCGIKNAPKHSLCPVCGEEDWMRR
ncbi:MAG: hypothetical protein C0602_02070 [Denitrovibrio sp.]|nr:MAG: hypothetical protein C0602_02070 [Denitrovibrio sp.]